MSPIPPAAPTPPMTPAKRLRAAVIVQLLKEGWRPPAPNNEQALRIVEDIVEMAGDRRGVNPRNESLNLTARELRVLEFAAAGDTAREIAGKLNRSPTTVKDYEKHVRRKLGARNNAHAVDIAHRQGLLDKAA